MPGGGGNDVGGFGESVWGYGGGAVRVVPGCRNRGLAEGIVFGRFRILDCLSFLSVIVVRLADPDRSERGVLLRVQGAENRQRPAARAEPKEAYWIRGVLPSHRVGKVEQILGWMEKYTK